MSKIGIVDGPRGGFGVEKFIVLLVILLALYGAYALEKNGLPEGWLQAFKG